MVEPSFYTMLYNQWAYTCVRFFGRALPMTNIASGEVLHVIPEGTTKLIARNGQEVNRVRGVYDLEAALGNKLNIN